MFSIIKFEYILTNYLYGKIENVHKFSLAGFISGVKSAYQPEDVEIKICSNDNNIVLVKNISPKKWICKKN